MWSRFSWWVRGKDAKAKEPKLSGEEERGEAVEGTNGTRQRRQHEEEEEDQEEEEVIALSAHALPLNLGEQQECPGEHVSTEKVNLPAACPPPLLLLLLLVVFRPSRSTSPPPCCPCCPPSLPSITPLD